MSVFERRGNRSTQIGENHLGSKDQSTNSSLANGRGSYVVVAGLKSRSRVQCRGRESNVAVYVAVPKSLVKIISVNFKLEFEVTE